jgi:hypothetical protein
MKRIGDYLLEAALRKGDSGIFLPSSPIKYVRKEYSKELLYFCGEEVFLYF